MKKKIPTFKSEGEEAKFWSKHSPLEYLEELKEEKSPFQFSVDLLKKIAEEHKEKKTAMTLRMEVSQIVLAKIIAKKSGDHYQTLIRRWVRERILRELKENPQLEEDIRRQELHLLHK